LAYLFYIRLFLRDSIRPNPISWIMFSYGTSLILFLEWRAGATWDVLFLPGVCAFMSIVVALLCLRRGSIAPSGRAERLAFGADLGLTLGYIALVGSNGSGPFFNAGFIIAGNLTAVTAFIPILISTWRNPSDEHVLPWAVWTLAYGLLGVTTWLSSGLSEPALLIYPVVSVFLHGCVAILAALANRKQPVSPYDNGVVYSGASTIDGQGIFARNAIESAAPICTLTGPVRRSSLFSSSLPNWIGIDANTWIDPEPPLDRINHSCDPNSALGEGLTLRALRPIAPNEEITLDYSTTEADFAWEMQCTCGAPSCRKHLRSIQVAFSGQIEPPVATPQMQRIWRGAQMKTPPRILRPISRKRKLA
jgi:hypothetical protein